MIRKRLGLIALLTVVLLGAVACDEGADDWDSSARVSGEVFTDATHTQGVPGVNVILEADPDAPNPYAGPDQWTVTDVNGHFQQAIFLGSMNGAYTYVADVSVTYFFDNKVFTWGGGITVGPGSTFTLPPVDTTMFLPYVGEE